MSEQTRHQNPDIEDSISRLNNKKNTSTRRRLLQLENREISLMNRCNRKDSDEIDDCPYDLFSQKLNQQNQPDQQIELSPFSKLPLNSNINNIIRNTPSLAERRKQSIQLNINNPQCSPQKNQDQSPFLSYLKLKNLRGNSILLKKGTVKSRFSDWNFIQSYIFISRFAKNLKEVTRRFRYQLLTEAQINYISDYSYNYQQQSNINQSLKIIKRRMIQLYEYFKVFSPTNGIIEFWKIIILITIIVQVFIIPVRFSFDIDFKFDSLEYYAFYKIPVVLLGTDILINFNTAYYHEGQFIINRQKIIRNYLKFNFFVDIITTAAIIMSNTQFKFVPLFFLLRVIWINNLLTDLAEHFQIIQRFSILSVLLKLVFMIFILAHFFGCCFHYIAIYEIQQGETHSWLHVQDLIYTDKITRYIQCLYYAFVTAATVGYGDVSPVTKIEKIFVIFFILISCGQFAFTINTIGTIFQEIAQKTMQSKKQRYDISSYMQNRDIQKGIQVKVLKYLDYINKKEEEGNEKGEKILHLISQELREEVYNDFYGQIVNSIPDFKLNFSDAARRKISLCMKEKIFGPGEIIFKQGDQDYCYYWIRKGEAELLIENKIVIENQKVNQMNPNCNDYQAKHLQILEEGQQFGVHEFWSGSGTQRKYTARARGMLHLIYISREDLIKQLKSYQEDYEQFMMIQDRLRQQLVQYVSECCFYCNEQSHFIDKCPVVQFKPFKSCLLNKYMFTSEQKRTKQVRSNQKKTNSLLTRKICFSKAKKLRLDILAHLLPDQYQNENNTYNDLLHEENDKEFQIFANEIHFDQKGELWVESEGSSILEGSILMESEDDDVVSDTSNKTLNDLNNSNNSSHSLEQQHSNSFSQKRSKRRLDKDQLKNQKGRKRSISTNKQKKQQLTINQQQLDLQKSEEEQSITDRSHKSEQREQSQNDVKLTSIEDFLIHPQQNNKQKSISTQFNNINTSNINNSNNQILMNDNHSSLKTIKEDDSIDLNENEDASQIQQSNIQPQNYINDETGSLKMKGTNKNKQNKRKNSQKGVNTSQVESGINSQSSQQQGVILAEAHSNSLKDDERPNDSFSIAASKQMGQTLQRKKEKFERKKQIRKQTLVRGGSSDSNNQFGIYETKELEEEKDNETEKNDCSLIQDSKQGKHQQSEEQQQQQQQNYNKTNKTNNNNSNINNNNHINQQQQLQNSANQGLQQISQSEKPSFQNPKNLNLLTQTQQNFNQIQSQRRSSYQGMGSQQQVLLYQQQQYQQQQPGVQQQLLLIQQVKQKIKIFMKY